jgi:flagellar protein FliJ
MDDPRRLDSIIKLAEQKKHDAGRDLVGARNQQNLEQQQLEQLEEFYGEYTRRFEQAASTGMNARQLNDYRVFMHNLESAIKQKYQQLREADNNVEARRDEWIDKHQRSKNLTNFSDQLSREKLLKNTRREQNESDDRSVPGAPYPPK